ncbi:MAG: nitrite reductase small subunit NirD [Candidatus Nanopelagicales bacterium]|nr:nitrite reductase small subunit NirD [Candidatus Nanopelagicales bacterium]
MNTLQTHVVGRLDDLIDGRGMAVLVDGIQIALFRVGREVFAVQQLDPYSGSYVMSRGIVGTRGDRHTVAAPMFKQIFDLRTGACLESHGRPPRDLSTWPVHVDADGAITVTADRS